VDDARSGIEVPYGDRLRESPKGVVHMEISAIGVDIAKHVDGVDSQGKIVLVRQLRRQLMIEFLRKLPCSLLGIQAV
jgi:transposase